MGNMIYAFQPYDQEGNLAKAYNKHVELVPNDDDWIVLRDADFMMLTPEYEKVMLEMVNLYPEYKLWTCYTNRVKAKPQIIKELYSEPRMDVHRNKAIELYNTKRHSVKEIGRVISGYVMMFQKKTWKACGKFRGNGMFGIDTRFSHDILKKGWKIGLMEGVYGMHYYRFNEGHNFHKKKKK